MTEFTLFHSPGACSHVTMTALEQCGVEYADHPINLAQGKQHSSAYRVVNPFGKIPTLVVNGDAMGENGAILWWLHRVFPNAGLFPSIQSRWTEAQILSDLFWVSSGWHPSVRANMMPSRWTTGDLEPVRARGKELVKPLFERFDKRLADCRWWFGDTWSILDIYFYWNYTTAEKGEFDLSGLVNLAAHRSQVQAWPAFQRALAREDAARERMMANGA